MIAPSYSPENRPLGHTAVAVNATMDIAAAIHALSAAIETGAGSPADTVEWRRILDRLPPHRINADGALAEWCWPALADRYDHRYLSHLYPVWPLREINPMDTPEPAATALRLRTTENDGARPPAPRVVRGPARRRRPGVRAPRRAADRGVLLPRLDEQPLSGHVGVQRGHGVRPACPACAVPGWTYQRRTNGYVHAVFESTVECDVEIYICAWKCESKIVNLLPGEPVDLLCSIDSTRIVKTKSRVSSW
ncbi:MAG TPA: hypothetical protein VJ914_39695 [Pseudonocardiaceae bacterium]|nr:hypothetical protein [Pseudonocardiaceae bacterium]